MLYLGTCPNDPAVADLLSRRRIGLMCQPGSNLPRSGWIWAADNGCFSPSAKRWDCPRWTRWLSRQPRAGCLFATVPDVVGDAERTLARFSGFAGVVRELRYPVALAAQDGLEPADVPWSEIDALFIGGSTDWKMSPAAFDLASEAREHGKWAHVGRVNSWKRFNAWRSAADSCDGTFLARGPKVNLPKLVGWLDRSEANPTLWEAA